VGLARDKKHQDGLGSLIRTHQVKKTGCFLTVLILISLACGTGCKKGGSNQKPQTVEEGIAQLRAAMIDASPQVQSNLYNGVSYGVRYGNYTQALEAMDAIAADPSLKPEQKKVADNVIELLKAAAQNQQNAPAPAQPAQ